jgi:hypothetical protein
MDIFRGVWLVHVAESHTGYLHFMQALLISCHCLGMHMVAHVLVTYLQSGEGAQIGGVFDADIGVSTPCRTVRVRLGCLLHRGWHVAYFQLMPWYRSLTNLSAGQPAPSARFVVRVVTTSTPRPRGYCKNFRRWEDDLTAADACAFRRSDAEQAPDMYSTFSQRWPPSK